MSRHMSRGVAESPWKPLGIKGILLQHARHETRAKWTPRFRLNICFYFGKWLAGEPGFEPGLTESESVGLPLTYSPKPPSERSPSVWLAGL